MEKYDRAVIEVCEFKSEDVISTSTSEPVEECNCNIGIAYGASGGGGGNPR